MSSHVAIGGVAVALSWDHFPLKALVDYT